MAKYLIKTLRHPNWVENGLPVWWGENSTGYTDNPDRAGRYEKEEAEKIVADNHKKDILVDERKIGHYRKRFMAIKVGRALSAIESTTIEQSLEIMAEVVKSKISRV